MKKLCCLLLVLLAVLTLGACRPMDTDPEIRAAVETLIEGILSDDADAILGVTTAISRDEAADALAQMRAVFFGSETEAHTLADCEITQTEVTAGKQNGWKYRTVTYSVKVNWRPETFVLTCTVMEPDTSKIARVGLMQMSPGTGSLTTMKGANAVQWLMVILWAAVLAFMVWIFVDCLRHKIPKKVLWALVIALGTVGLTFAITANGTHFSFTLLNVFDPGRLEIWANGNKLLKFYVPVGAILYLLLRRRLITKSEKAAAAEAQVRAALETLAVLDTAAGDTAESAKTEKLTEPAESDAYE